MCDFGLKIHLPSFPGSFPSRLGVAITQFAVRMWPSAAEELASAFSSSWEGAEAGAESLLVLTSSEHYSR